MTSKTLIIGASGGIGNALVSRFADNGDEVIAVSRSGYVDSSWPDNVSSKTIAEHDEASISAFVEELKSQGIKLNNVVVTTGVLKDDDLGVNPEKRLEDMSENALASYFAVNSIIPALWLKHLDNH
ncbi:SDR family NAD(P)-dependent oxidoreductase [Alteromonas sp. BMJM2]|uniref:SDR family NAD(P)-dependent oxidoreductase n=1 Tax=Alteromonas sp. BMJM2 TaxID=2954241 RepID=UPI0022B3A182|nr:SDR family NAD(P)-dependent oxidoreductase [Alteromonas sp. BMJM2]